MNFPMRVLDQHCQAVIAMVNRLQKPKPCATQTRNQTKDTSVFGNWLREKTTPRVATTAIFQRTDSKMTPVRLSMRMF